jgi:cyanophycinase
MRLLSVDLVLSVALSLWSSGCDGASGPDGHADTDANVSMDAPMCAEGPRPSLPSGLFARIVGNADVACTRPSQAGLLLMGGGSDVDAAFRKRIKPRLGAGDVVVLRTTGTDAYNSYLFSLLAPDSVETIVVDSVAKANSDYVEWAVRTAELVWFAGGDQADYLDQWKGTKLQAAVTHVRENGGLIGGTSAGLAILGDVIYDPDQVTAVISSEAVVDPCGSAMLFADQFLAIPATQNLILEPHFHERDRMGRLLAFMARIGGPTSLTPHRSPITGVAIDEATSMFVDGHGVVDGAGAVYILRDDVGTQRTTVQCGHPIVYGGVRRTKLAAGDAYDLPSGQTSATSIAISIDGRNTTFYSPPNPY